MVRSTSEGRTQNEPNQTRTTSDESIRSNIGSRRATHASVLTELHESEQAAVGSECSDIKPTAENPTSIYDGMSREAIEDLREKDAKAASSRGWTNISQFLQAHDHRVVQDQKEDIDTLLVFAGLFSAVLTAFNIELYKGLQPDPQAASAYFLSQLALQVNNSATNAALAAQFQPSETSSASVRINALMFVSLLLSLITASVGILVKQWFRAYLRLESGDAVERCRIRDMRQTGLLTYRVFEIAATLPLLMQAALFLFFLGLSDFLRSLNPVVGWLATAIVIIWLVAILATTLMPAIDPKCPYKTPFVQDILRRLHSSLSFSKHFVLGPASDRGRTDDAIDIPSLLRVDQKFVDNGLVVAIGECLYTKAYTVTLSQLQSCISDIEIRRHHSNPSDKTTLVQASVHGTISVASHIFPEWAHDITRSWEYIVKNATLDVKLYDILDVIFSKSVEDDSDLIPNVALKQLCSATPLELAILRKQSAPISRPDALQTIITCCRAKIQRPPPRQNNLAAYIAIFLFLVTHTRRAVKNVLLEEIGQAVQDFGSALRQWRLQGSNLLPETMAEQCLTYLEVVGRDFPKLDLTELYDAVTMLPAIGRHPTLGTRSPSPILRESPRQDSLDCDNERRVKLDLQG
ncbi:unnamed protein product [Somion occarium]|uniref:DUF6535 domain-containing protein n=1 Tax=Somion occarium TaxID=3059160 RepID=A0ABP1CW77_9APHY